MNSEQDPEPRARVHAALERLREWLIQEAMPLWSTRGIDPVHGGFEERLSEQGAPLYEARRARVQPRQIFAFAGAVRLGWRGAAAPRISSALDYFVTHYRRTDGFYRTLVARDGTVLDNGVWLYDQAFALLGFGAARRLLGNSADLESAARHLLTAIRSALGRENGGFDTGLALRLPLQSNPHMHLLESCLEWSELSDEPCWHELCAEIVALACRSFIDQNTGALRETFAADWSPAEGLSGRLLEPGHQFEWAWLLLRWRGTGQAEARAAALRLIELAERAGVRHGVAIDALLDDFSVYRSTARLWPQTERLRALASAAALTGEPRYWRLALESAQTLMRYLDATVPGLWHDELLTDGHFRIGPAPAGNLYHIVGTIEALRQALAITEPAQSTP